MADNGRMKLGTASLVQIVVAVIGLIGILGAALLANWDKVFGPINYEPDASISISQPSSNGTTDMLAAPVMEKPQCNSARKWPPDNHLFPIYWHPVDHAASYGIEIDCRSAEDDPTAWRGSEEHPWFIKRGVAFRMMNNPIYSSKIHLKMKKVGCDAIRWRIWAIDHDGKDGKKGEWCQVSFF